MKIFYIIYVQPCNGSALTHSPPETAGSLLRSGPSYDFFGLNLPVAVLRAKQEQEGLWEDPPGKNAHPTNSHKCTRRSSCFLGILFGAGIVSMEKIDLSWGNPPTPKTPPGSLRSGHLNCNLVNLTEVIVLPGGSSPFQRSRRTC